MNGAFIPSPMLPAVLAIAALSAVPQPPWDRVASHYRRETIAERVTFTAKSPASERASTVIMRVSHRGATAPIIRLDLGNLIIWADNTRIVGTHASNPNSYFETTLPAGLSPEAIQDHLPPLIMPQLGWAITTDAPIDDWWPVLGAERVRIAPELPPAGDNHDELALSVVETTGQPRIDSITISQSGGLRRAMLTYPGAEGSTLQLIAEALPTEESTQPESWAVPTSGRTRVERLSDLRPAPRDVEVGDACPALSLVTQKVEGWSFANAVKHLQSLNPQPSGPVWVALLVRLPSTNESAVTLHAARALDTLSREYSIQRMQGLRNSPRVEAHDVIVLELGDVTPQRIAELSKPIIPGTESLAPRLFSTAGVATFHRVAPGAAQAILILDEHQRLAGVVPLDGRLIDAQTIAAEVRRIVSTSEAAPESKPPAPENSGSAGDGGH